MKGGIKMNKKRELKPCPFCGGKVAIRRFNGGVSGTGISYQVICPNDDVCRVSPMTDWGEKQENVIAIWNTRRRGNTNNSKI